MGALFYSYSFIQLPDNLLNNIDSSHLPLFKFRFLLILTVIMYTETIHYTSAVRLTWFEFRFICHWLHFLFHLIIPTCSFLIIVYRFFCTREKRGILHKYDTCYRMPLFSQIYITIKLSQCYLLLGFYASFNLSNVDVLVPIFGTNT